MEVKTMENQSVPNKGQILSNVEAELNKDVSEASSLIQGICPPVDVEQEPLKLEPGIIVAISVLRKLGYRFGFIKLNRDIDMKIVNKKKQSIKVCNGLITPMLVAFALECLNEGLELVDEDRNPIMKDTPDVEFILIVIDGQHRLEALKRLNDEVHEKGKKEYEGYCHLPLIEHYNIVTLLREANISTSPWNGMDWLSQLLDTAAKNGISTDKLEWVKNQSTKGSDSAAWLWMGGQIKSKAECINASNNIDKLKKLADTSSFKEDKKLYEAASMSFNTDNTYKVLGWKVFPKWVYEKLEDLLKKNMLRSEAISLLTKFLGNISHDSASEISKIKKKQAQSKDDQIIVKLDELFAEFEKTTANKTTDL